MNNILISIIVPVYNVSEYLQDCLDSIRQQTYKNIEILCINDGSTDDSAGIIERNRKIDSRIIHLMKTNGGLSSARNLGLENIKGEYVCFIDSDDWVEKGLIEKAMRVANRCRADIVCYGFQYEYLNEDYSKQIKFDKNSIFDYDKGNFSDLFEIFNKGLFNSVVNKLYKRDLFDNYASFGENNMPAEDMIFNLEIFNTKFPRTVLIKDVFYHYNKRDTITTVNKFTPNYFDVMNIVISELTNTFKKYNLSFKIHEDYLEKTYVELKFNTIINLFRKNSPLKFNDKSKLFADYFKTDHKLMMLVKKYKIKNLYDKILVNSLIFKNPKISILYLEFWFRLKRILRPIYSNYRKRILNKNAK